ncbi:hypothetical protein DQ04_22491000 [Trypanosoma grayi]|uniref:hypothetical protein n=1 Tax=Trypanosoma grayi TaxID=71804 RepID=UPI0004F44200|nr:hypothetical protein DQ04_22491000 [Trypanosoma grayi]KEG05391.1 hypothetical protein DQ04_22491000 [Trypanosoma grayi]
MLLADLRKTASASPIKQARPMEREKFDLISDLLTLKGDRAAPRPALAAASRRGAIALPQKENFKPHPYGKEALIIDWGALSKTFKINPTRRSGICSFRGEGAKKALAVKGIA